jgi:ureidoglycolate lyase
MLKYLAEADLSSLVRVLKTDAGKRVTFPEVQDSNGLGRTVMTVSRAEPVAGTTISIPRLERHPHTTQTFIPLSVSRWLIVAAPSTPNGEPDLGRVQAAIGRSGDAVCLMRNVWHATLTVLDTPAEVVMLMWRADAGDDTVLFELEKPLQFTF